MFVCVRSDCPGIKRNFDWWLSGHSANGPLTSYTMSQLSRKITCPVLGLCCVGGLETESRWNANHTRWIYLFCTVFVFACCPHISSEAQSVVGSLSAHYLVITHNLLQQTCYKDRQLGVFLPKLTRDWPLFSPFSKEDWLYGFTLMGIFVTSLDPGAQSIRCCCYQSYYRL